MSQRPDQGWSWVVVLAACFCSLVLAGIFRTSGVLFVAFIATFGVSREEAAWPMGVCISVLNLTGPLSGILGQRYGVRPVVIAGSIIGAVGVSACYFTTSLTVITILFGGVFGVGYGLVNTLFPVIVNAYFLNLRSMANGIANSGSCFGSIILPVLYEYLIANYDLSGCFLITGGIVLNVAVAGALMRPTPWSQPRHSNRCVEKGTLSAPRKPSVPRNVLNCSIPEEMVPSPDPKSEPQRHLQAELVSALNKRTTFHATELTNFAEESYDSLGTSSSSNDRKDSIRDRLQIELLRAEKEFEDTLGDFQSVAGDIAERSSKSEEVLNRMDSEEVKTSDLTDSCPARHSFSVSSAKRPQKFKSPIPSSGPLKKYSFKLSDCSRESNLYPVSETDRVTDAEVTFDRTGDQIPEDEEVTDGKTPSPTILGSFRTVLTSTMFHVTAVTNVSFYFLYHMYVVVVVDYSIDQGVPEEDTKYVLFAFAMSDLFGRLCLGWVTDRKLLTRPRFVMVGMVGIGVVFFALPFATEYWSLLLVSCCYGVLLGCTMVIFPILLVDYLGQEVHAVAYGCMCFMNGFTSLVRPLVIGYFRDYVGTYHNMFYILGAISIIASTLWILEKCFHPKHRPSAQYEPMTDKS